MITPEEFRAHFPVLGDTVHLASCSLGPRSSALDAAMTRMLDALAADPTPWDAWIGAVEQSRHRFARLVNAPVERVAVVPSATVGAYQAVSTRRPGRIVATDDEYPSVAHVWAAQRPRGSTVDFTSSARLEETMLGADFVSVPLVAYTRGCELPVATVVERAREAGATTFVDAYQAAGILPIDVGELGCDFLVSGTMKYLLGLPGIAYLYVREGIADDLEPQLTGFYGRTNPLAFDPHTLDFPSDARRYQVNMPTLPVALAADGGLALIEQLDIKAVAAHVAALASRAADRLGAVAGPQVVVPDPDPAGLARWLNERRIFPARGTQVRLSFHYFNTAADVDAACAAISEWRAK